MLSSFARRLVTLSQRRHWPTLAAALLLAALGLAAAATDLGMNTDTDALFDADLPFRQAEKAYDRQFPADQDLILVLIDAPSKMQAQRAADRLAAALAPHDELFREVRTPEGGPFFAHNGLLYLTPKELDELSTNLAQAQPLLGAIAGDRSARGLFRLLTLAFDAAGEGNTAALGLAPAAQQAATVIDAVRAGRPAAIDWTALLSGLSPQDQAPRSFVLVQPHLDSEALAQGGAASAEIRRIAADIGLTSDRGYRVRLTGDVPLNDDEFSTVAQGTGVSGALAIGLVGLLLYLALGSIRVVLAAVATLAVGLIYTLAWAALAVGELNLISIAFAVMFVGIAVDFSIQFLMRYRAERHGGLALREALIETGAAMARPLLLAAVATAVGFFSFLPTAYRGVAQLGVIAGGGMLIALALTFTVLPALLRAVKPGAEPAAVGYDWAAPLNRWLVVHRRRVLGATALAAVAALAVLPRLTFDFDPLKLKDPKSESMAAVLEIMDDPWATPNTLNVLAPTLDAAKALADRLGALPEVRETLTVQDLIPENQDEKRAILDDLALLLGPALEAAAPREPPAPEQVMAAAEEARRKAQGFLEGAGSSPEMAPLRTAAQRLVAALDGLRAAPEPTVFAALSSALVGNLDEALAPLRDALSPQPVTLASLPEDVLASWIAADGRYRVQVYPRGDARDIKVIGRFVTAVRSVAPDAMGPPVIITETGRIVTQAFERAAALALLSITVLLFVVLRRAADVVRVLTPLLLAALFTLATCAATGLSLNFANIIGLPLLLGVGVTFPIYLVAAWRDGEERLLAAPAARAVVFSALTTAAAFGSLAFSGHPGTAGLGILLSIALGFTLLMTLIVLPAQLGPPPPAAERGRAKYRAKSPGRAFSRLSRAAPPGSASSR
jgi:hopanoid biosynthesis associated RND transporter like protein HpnN